ncbi:MAG: type secretion system protein [Rhodospirillales bacterium]|nr:type secretion system protein [Rhodospirillales bacterium]
MTAFRYVAVDSAGTVHKGAMEAVSEAGVIESLQRQGYIPLKAEPDTGGGWASRLIKLDLTRQRGLSRTDVANVTRELATMLGAGQNLDAALRFLIETAGSARIVTIVGRVREKVRGGSSLASALAAEPHSFPRLYVSLVQAGEAGGNLTDTFERMATLLERQQSLTATVQSAMIYPVLLIITAIGSIALLLTKVLPQFVPLFQESGAALPRPTRILIALGDFTASAGPWILIALLLLGLGIRRSLKDARVRRWADGAVLRLPIAGGLVRLTLAARFSRTLGTLLMNGVPLITALGIAKETLGNLAAAEAVDWAIGRARSGAGMAHPLSERGIFPPRMIHLLRLGEETAQLGSMALKTAEIHEEQTRVAVQRLVSLMVPAITVVMGAAVAFIVGSLLAAMLSLNDLAG